MSLDKHVRYYWLAGHPYQNRIKEVYVPFEDSPGEMIAPGIPDVVDDEDCEPEVVDQRLIGDGVTRKIYDDESISFSHPKGLPTNLLESLGLSKLASTTEQD
ncbi:MAG: hypothetical protein AAF702_49630 [Chloroflexota bacterium]